MPQAAPLQNNFNSGEFSPLMEGRVDFERYKSAMKVCKNHLAFLQGGVTRRPGIYHIDEVKDSRRRTRLVKFKYSTVSAYVLEFSDHCIRFKNRTGPIHAPGLAINAITKANPAVLTYSGPDPIDGTHLDIAGVAGMTEVNGRRFMAINVNAAAHTLELWTLDGVRVDSRDYGTFVLSGGAEPVYEVITPYDEADLFQLKFAQSADVLYIWHPDYPEMQLHRLAVNVWTLTPTVFYDGPYLRENAVLATTLRPSGTTGSITITANQAASINGNAGFLSSDVGRLVRIKHNAAQGYALITAYQSALVVIATVINPFGGTGTSSVWRLGLYSETTGYPACGTFYGDRLWRGGCPEVSERIDGSRVGDYDNLSASDPGDGTVTDSHAVDFRLNSDDVQTIFWMKGTANGICIGTFEGEWLVTPSTLNEAITPTNVNAKQSTDWGSANIQAVKAGQALLFVEAGGRRIREMNYLYYENILQSVDTTVLAEHITKGRYDPAQPHLGLSTPANSGVLEIAFQKKKIPTLWAVRADGALLSMTYSKDDKVMGWQRQILGGWSDAEQTEPAVVESVCVIPSADGRYDETWVLVRRWINGRSVRYTGVLLDVWEQGNAQADAIFLDSARTYRGAPADQITGLWHLAGETVQVLVDGATHPDVTVSQGGVIDLDRLGSVVHVGYAYDSDGACLRFDAGSATGTAQGKVMRINMVIPRLYDSLGLLIGPSFDHLEELTFRTTADLMDQAVPLFTGDKDDFSWNGDYSTEALICWRWREPLPGTILAIMPQLQTQDRI